MSYHVDTKMSLNGLAVVIFYHSGYTLLSVYGNSFIVIQYGDLYGRQGCNWNWSIEICILTT